MITVLKVLILVVLIPMGVLLSGIVSHEVAHMEIYRLYGADDTEVHFFDGGFMSVSADICDVPSGQRGSLRLAHSINEVVGYTLIPLFSILAIVFGVNEVME